MASTTGKSAIISAIRTVSGNQPNMQRIAEKAAQATTLLAGTPVEVDLATGFLIPWDGTTIGNGTSTPGVIAGITKENFNNLTTSGVPQTLTYGSVPNQASAVNIPEGAPINDGKLGVEVANQDSIFYGQVGTTVAATDLGKQYGLTKDTDGHWYVDKAKSTAGTNTVLVIVKLDPVDTARGVQFMFLPTQCQLQP